MQLHLLPIAERELRAASRRRTTFRLRWSVALIAIFASFVWYQRLPRAAVATSFVNSLFGIQSVCAFAFALLAGPFLTSDSLSEERREGTLNLLFLTALRARGIVWGKFAGTGLIAMYVLFALVPVTAIPLLLGGVSFAEFVRTDLVLANTLFFSLAAGLGVSAFVKSYSRALTVTISLILLFAVAPLLLAWCGATWAPGYASLWAATEWLSTATSFRSARDVSFAANPLGYWMPLLLTHMVSWMFIALATWYLARSWQDRPEAGATQRQMLRKRRPRALSSKPFDPLVRLLGNMPVLRAAVWLIVAVFTTMVVINRYYHIRALDDVVLARIICFLLKILVAFQACRFFVETRRSGALELLFCTPVRNSDLLRAQWRGLLRVFLWPALLFLAAAWWNVTHPVAGSGARVFLSSLDEMAGARPGYLTTLFMAIGLGADLLALGWFGMYVALTMKKPGLAPGLTIAAVLILPSLLSYFDLVADMLFISWATTRLKEEFRWQSAIPIRGEPIPT